MKQFDFSLAVSDSQRFSIRRDSNVGANARQGPFGQYYSRLRVEKARSAKILRAFVERNCRSETFFSGEPAEFPNVDLFNCLLPNRFAAQQIVTEEFSARGVRLMICYRDD